MTRKYSSARWGVVPKIEDPGRNSISTTNRLRQCNDGVLQAPSH